MSCVGFSPSVTLRLRKALEVAVFKARMAHYDDADQRLWSCEKEGLAARICVILLHSAL